MFKKIISTIFLILAFAVFAESWDAELEITAGTSSFIISFGRDATALDGVDELDDILAIPPPGSYAYFEIDDPLNPYVSMLYGDIRPDNGDSSIWTANIVSSAVSFEGSWNPAELPAGEFRIGAYYPTGEVSEWIDMKEQSSITFMPAQLLDIVHTPEGVSPDDDPVFSNWYPPNNATSIPTTTPIRVDVTDAGSGIDPSSISFTVAGYDVTSEIELTPIGGGYRITYEPDTPLPGETWISAAVEASDNATPPNTASDIIAFKTGYDMVPALWEFAFMAYTFGSSDTSYMNLSLGGNPGATDGYDYALDIIYPIAPPMAFYAYFPLDDTLYPLYTKLVRDIHDSEPMTDIWNIRFGNIGSTIGLTWDIDDIPENKEAYVATTFPPYLPGDEDWIDMSTVDYIEFGPGRQGWIKVISPFMDTLPPDVVFVSPSDGETGVAVSTDIQVYIIDDGNGVDDGSVELTVEGEDVTSLTTVTASGGTTYVSYTPAEDFPPLTNIDVELHVADLTDPPNITSYTWDFTTGYFLTPTWMESVAVWTDEVGEPLRHFTLHFGADVAGTDLFDYGLDQQMPPPPPGDIPYGYFAIEDTFWNQLARDIRSSEDDDIIWSAMIFRISSSGDITNWISWAPDGLPEDGSFYIAWYIAGDTVWQNMRTTDSIAISTPGNLLIHFTRAEPPTYCLSGSVTGSDSVPIEGAYIVLPEVEGASDTSDENSLYEICEIPSGTWTVITSMEGYIPDTTEITFDDDKTYNPTLTLLVATVQGTVTCDDEGSPEDAMVILGDDTTYANSTGSYAFYNVRYGDYTLTVSLNEFYETELREIVVDEPEEEENFTLSRKYGQIVGTITLSDDPSSLAGTMIELVGTEISPAYTNADGYYIIADIPYNNYDVQISRDGYFTLDTIFTLLQSEDTLDAQLEAEPIPLNPPQNLTGNGLYRERAVLNWDPPEETDATLLGYNIYRERLFLDDTLVGFVPEPYTSFIEWQEFLLYTYKVTALYEEGESEAVTASFWSYPDTTTPDIFVWDFDNGDLLAIEDEPVRGARDEATFLQERLEIFGDLNVAKSVQDGNFAPDADLFQYRAIFMVNGTQDAPIFPNNESIEKLAAYIVAGGKVYVEGADFGFWYGSEYASEKRKGLFELFGVNFAFDGYLKNEGNVVSLTGENTDFFTEGAVDIDYQYKSNADQRIDEYDFEGIDDPATCAMFSQSSPPPFASPYRMCYRETENGRTVISSVYLGSMVDNQAPSTRQHVLAAIVNYLLGTDYTLVKEKKQALPKNLGIVASPNPFNAAVKLDISVDSPGKARLDIFDITGRSITTLADEYVASGFYSATWDGRDKSGIAVPSGVYFAVLRLGDRYAKTRLVLVK